MNKEPKIDDVNPDEVQPNDDSIEEVVKIARTKMSVRQKKELGLIPPRRPRTDKQKVNDERLREVQNKKAEDARKEKDAYEISQLKKLKLDDLNQFHEFLEFKKMKSLGEIQQQEKHDIKEEKKEKPKKIVKEVVEEDSDDGFIQAKSKKAQKIAKAVEDIDNKINKLQISTPVNPYLEMFNKIKK